MLTPEGIPVYFSIAILFVEDREQLYLCWLRKQRRFTQRDQALDNIKAAKLVEKGKGQEVLGLGFFVLVGFFCFVFKSHIHHIPMAVCTAQLGEYTMPCSRHNFDSNPAATEPTSSSTPAPRGESQLPSPEGPGHHHLPLFQHQHLMGKGPISGAAPSPAGWSRTPLCQGLIPTKLYGHFHKASCCHISLCLLCPAIYFKPSTNAVLQQRNAPIDQASI